MVKAYDGDYELEEAFPTSAGEIKGFPELSYPSMIPLLPAKTAGYSAIAESFESAVDRCTSIWALPAELIFWTALHASCLHQARMDLGLKSVDDESKDETDEMKAVHTKLFVNNLGAVLENGIAWFRNNITRFGSEELKKWISRELTVSHAPFNQRVLCEGVEAILGTMIMSTYAAFEIMATDLWESALNRNDSLAQEYIKKHKKDASTAEDLLRYGLNLSGKMGSVFLRKERAQSFNDIKKLFTDVFGDEVEAAFVGSSEVFQTEQVRHLLAHRGGVIDERFRDKMKNYPDYQNLKVGEKLELKGPIVKKHLSACMECAASLFHFVDDWTEYQEKEDASVE